MHVYLSLITGLKFFRQDYVILQGTVYLYYGLNNFYQNHRRYVKSRDDYQLLGRLSDNPSSDCDPFRINNNKPIAPCGAIANSLFNGENMHDCS